MIRQSLQIGREVHPQFVHPREVSELLYRAGDICLDHFRQTALRETFLAPQISNQCAAFLCNVASRMNRDRAVVNELR
jgi:hypothetical protein